MKWRPKHIIIRRHLDFREWSQHKLTWLGWIFKEARKDSCTHVLLHQSLFLLCCEEHRGSTMKPCYFYMFLWVLFSVLTEVNGFRYSQLKRADELDSRCITWTQRNQIFRLFYVVGGILAWLAKMPPALWPLCFFTQSSSSISSLFLQFSFYL